MNSNDDPKPSIPAYLADRIETALAAARMKHANFAPFKAPEENEKIKDAVRIYMITYVIGPLETALAAVYGVRRDIRDCKEAVREGHNDIDTQFRNDVVEALKRQDDKVVRL